jgi:hypothetical protein
MYGLLFFFFFFAVGNTRGNFSSLESPCRRDLRLPARSGGTVGLQNLATRLSIFAPFHEGKAPRKC